MNSLICLPCSMQNLSGYRVSTSGLVKWLAHKNSENLKNELNKNRSNLKQQCPFRKGVRYHVPSAVGNGGPFTMSQPLGQLETHIKPKQGRSECGKKARLLSASCLTEAPYRQALQAGAIIPGSTHQGVTIFHLLEIFQQQLQHIGRFLAHPQHERYRVQAEAYLGATVGLTIPWLVEYTSSSFDNKGRL